jgi:hypothetical protein
MDPKDFGLSVEVEVISPANAEAYLKNNAHHRKVKQKKIDNYVQDLEEGRWRLNGKTITFDSNGRLLGGQHRLHAVVQSGKSLTTLVVRGLDPEILETNPENNVIITE